VLDSTKYVRARATFFAKGGALSNIIATLVLMTIVVISGVFLYTYSVNAVGSIVTKWEENHYEAFSLDTFTLNETFLIAYIRNIGQVDSCFDGAYVNNVIVAGVGYRFDVHVEGALTKEVSLERVAKIMIETPEGFQIRAQSTISLFSSIKMSSCE
jgi:hypothetical protein